MNETVTVEKFDLDQAKSTLAVLKEHAKDLFSVGDRVVVFFSIPLVIWWITCLAPIDLSAGWAPSQSAELDAYLNAQNAVVTNCRSPLFEFKQDSIKRQGSTLESARKGEAPSKETVVNTALSQQQQFSVFLEERIIDLESEERKKDFQSCIQGKIDFGRSLKALLTAEPLKFAGFEIKNINVRYHSAIFAVAILWFAFRMSYIRRRLTLILNDIALLGQKYGSSIFPIDVPVFSRLPFWIASLRFSQRDHDSVNLYKLFTPTDISQSKFILRIVLSIITLACITAITFQGRISSVVPTKEMTVYFILADVIVTPDGEQSAQSVLSRFENFSLTGLRPLDIFLLCVIVTWCLISFLRSFEFRSYPSTAHIQMRRRSMIRDGSVALLFAGIGASQLFFGLNDFSKLKTRVVTTLNRQLLADGRRPRFRSPPLLAKMNWPGGWYSGRKGIAHFLRETGPSATTMSGVGPVGLSSEGTSLAPSAVAALSDPASVPRLNATRYSEGIEATAVRLWNDGNSDQAIDVLKTGIAYAKLIRRYGQRANLRLYDLLAALSVRSGQAEALTDLSTQLGDLRQAFGDVDDRRMAARIAAWATPDSKWRQRWSNDNREHRWNGIDLRPFA